MKDLDQLEWPWLREIVIDRHDAMPPVEQVVNALRNKIATGQLRANDVVPSVRVFANHIGTTPTTVSRAYQVLQREGLLTTATGLGTTVADIENLQQSARSGMLDAAGQVLTEAMNSLASLGLGPTDLEQMLRARSAELEQSSSLLAFIARKHTNLELYQQQIRQATVGLPVRVVCVPLEALEARDTAALELVEAAEVVTSLITYKRRLPTLIDQADQVRYIIAEVSMDAAEALTLLSPKTTVALAAGEAFRTVGLGILHTYCSPERIIVLRDIDSPDSWHAVPEDAVVVHTYQRRHLASKMAPTHERICLDFELRADSLKRLREFISERLLDARVGA